VYALAFSSDLADVISTTDIQCVRGEKAAKKSVHPKLISDTELTNGFD
jgi:hypothetical protein